MAAGGLPRPGQASCKPLGKSAASGFRGTPEGSVRPGVSSRRAGGAQVHSGKRAGTVLCVSTKGPEWSYFSPCKDSKSSGIVPRNPITHSGEAYAPLHVNGTDRDGQSDNCGAGDSGVQVV